MAAADVEIKFGADITQIGTATNAVKVQLRELGDEAQSFGAHAQGATVGKGFWTRELRALGDELSSGRYRQADGTFLNLAAHAVQAGGAWAIANPALLALGAAATAAAAAVAYLVYESIAANNAMKNLELAAVVAQYQLTNEQASALRDTIEQFAGVGASDAAEIAKPFVALGEGGALIATQLAPLLQLLAENMGQKLPEAAKELSKYFSDLSGKGRTLVAATNGINSAQLQQFDRYVQTGQTGKAYLLVIDALTRGVEDFANKQRLQTAALQDAIPSLEAAESGVMGLSRAQSDLGGAVDAANAKIAAQNAALAAGRQALESVAASDQKAYEAANKAADAVDKQGTEIKRLQSQIEVLATGLTKALASANPDPISIEHWRAAILQAQRDLEELTSKQGNLFGGVTQQVDHAIKEVQDRFKGSKPAELQLEIKTITTALNRGGVPEKDRQELQDQLAAKQKALAEAAAKDAEEESAAEIKLFTDSAAKQASILDGELKRRQVTTEQWLAGTKDALADELQDTIATYQARRKSAARSRPR